jgi:deoxyribonuclease-1-like protein
MKSHQFSFVVSILASCLLFCFVGCEPGSVAYDPSVSGGQIPSGVPVTTQSRNDPRIAGIPVRNQQSILIASFNIQAFGEEKMRDPWVMERIVHIIHQFDIVAIQEVRAKDQTLLPRLLKLVNANGSRYEYLLGPRLGRTSSKEQYAYVYNTDSVVSSPDACYTVEDRADLLHREPLVARFVTRVPRNVRPFSFSLVNMHTDPDEVKDEMPVMHTVLKGIREFEYLSANGEDDVLLMGDLNAAPHQFGPLAQVPGIFWIINNEPTNTIRKSIYDNIIFDRGLTSEFTGRCGVLDMAEMFQIRTEDALRISDHLPVWAEFSMVEQTPNAMSPAYIGQSPFGAQR